MVAGEHRADRYDTTTIDQQWRSGSNGDRDTSYIDVELPLNSLHVGVEIVYSCVRFDVDGVHQDVESTESIMCSPNERFDLGRYGEVGPQGNCASAARVHF
ncbi:hypothetical protein AWV79_30415 [Cupriavidus sp. UYMMa02A]|nr:hypothetical protein AWV79_30415 [Cupriavidus sp. UYMMa02A]